MFLFVITLLSNLQIEIEALTLINKQFFNFSIVIRMGTSYLFVTHSNYRCLQTVISQAVLKRLSGNADRITDANCFELSRVHQAVCGGFCNTKDCCNIIHGVGSVARQLLFLRCTHNFASHFS